MLRKTGLFFALAALVGLGSAFLLAPATEPAYGMGGDPMVGEIGMFAGNFAPRGWAFCDGQLLPISQYSTLFSILGTTYGGDGRTTFALPDLRGRVAVHPGSGPGLSNYRLGERGGSETVTLTAQQLPAGLTSPDAIKYGDQTEKVTFPMRGYSVDNQASLELRGLTVGASLPGGGQPISIRQPYLAVNYCIALVGIYPSRN
jgi:microcystin-dependent protein